MNLRTVEKCEVAIVGAGPAGSVAARELARRGIAVVLIDKAIFPRWKVCGCCLNLNALSTLRMIGLAELPRKAGAIPLHRLCLGAGGRKAMLSLPGGVSLSRESFDQAMIQTAIQAGSRFLPGTRATMESEESDFRTLRLEREGVESVLQARVVLAADGLNGRLAASAEGFEVHSRVHSRIGAGTILSDAPAQFQPGIIYMATSKGGYVGMVRLAGDQLDLAAAFDSELVREAGSLASAAEKILKENRWKISGLGEANWKGTPALTRTPERIAGHRWFALGDSAGYVEPFTGEGMAWAMSSAVTIVPLVQQGLVDWNPRLAVEWKRVHHRVVGGRQRTCRWLARLLLHPTLCSLAVRGLAAMPLLARPLIHWLNHRSTPVAESYL